MRRKIIILSIILLVVIGGAMTFIFGQNKDSRTPQQVLIDHFSQLHHFSGNAFIFSNGDTLTLESRGVHSLEPNLLNQRSSRFAIGSVSKHFAAVLILLLEEEEKLTTDDPIRTHLPHLPEAWNDITIYHLLTHTSGMANSTEIFNTPEMLAQGRTMENSFKVVEETPLAFEPGSQYSYCNTGYNYLAHIIEKVSGKSFEANLKEKIFQPLGMKNSGSILDFSEVDNLATGFVTKNNIAVPVEDRGLVSELLQGAGAIYSTIDDLLIWDRALRENKLLSKEQKEKMFTPFLDDYGLGWRIREIEVNGQDYRIVTHSGHLDGFLTNFVRIPELDFCMIIMSNNQDTPIKDLSKGLIETSLKAGIPDSFFLPSNKDLFSPYAGIFKMEDGTIFEISFYDKGINMKTEGYPQLPFFPAGGHSFKSAYPFVPAKINFTLNDKNTIIAMDFIYEDESHPAKKTEDTP